MAAPLEARRKQRAVIEFLVAEGETPLRIHNRLKNVYKDNTIDYSNVKTWVQRFKKSTEDHKEVGKVSIVDKPRSGRPSTSVNPDNKTYADELIRTDRRITVGKLASKLDVSIGSAHSIVASLGYSKVCARWVPRQLTEDHKLKEFAAALSFWNTTMEIPPFWKESLLEMKHKYTILNLNLKGDQWNGVIQLHQKPKSSRPKTLLAKLWPRFFGILKV